MIQELILNYTVWLYVTVCYLVAFGALIHAKNSLSRGDFLGALLAPVTVPIGLGRFFEIIHQKPFEKIQRELIAAQSDWLKELLQKEKKCRHCGVVTDQPESECYKAPASGPYRLTPEAQRVLDDIQVSMLPTGLTKEERELFREIILNEKKPIAKQPSKPKRSPRPHRRAGKAKR